MAAIEFIAPAIPETPDDFAAVGVDYNPGETLPSSLLADFFSIVTSSTIGGAVTVVGTYNITSIYANYPSDIFGKVSSGPTSTDNMFTAPVLDAGALQTPELHNFYIWNGSTSAVTINSILLNNADGITYAAYDYVVISGGSVSPGWVAASGNSIPALATRRYDITFTPTGTRSFLNGTMTFAFSTGQSIVLQLLASEYGTWLAYDNANRCLLVEASRYGSETEYLSNLGYVSRSYDTPANRGYAELLVGNLEIRSRIDGDLVVGNIEVDNTSGDYDLWIGYAFEGWPISVYLGDLSWPRDAFTLVATGTIEAVTSPSADRLAFSIRDKRKLLDKPVCSTRLNDGRFVPVCLGECFNIEPVFSSGSTYYVHDGAVTDISVLRDNGVSATFTPYLGSGYVVKSAAAYGTLTADVIGATAGSAFSMIEWLAKRVGLTDADLDWESFYAFPNTCGLGLYVSDESTASQCISMVMESVGGSWRFSRTGKLQIFRLDAPAAENSVLSLTGDDIEEMGVSVDTIEPPVNSISLGYRRNWTVQASGTLPGGNGIATSVSAANRDLYSRQYTVTKSTSATIRNQYPLAEDSDLVGTLIVGQTDADNEADRRLTLRGQKRAVYNVKCFALPFSIQIGQVVTITFPRFGFDNGLPAVVVGMRELPLIDRVELQVWR